MLPRLDLHLAHDEVGFADLLFDFLQVPRLQESAIHKELGLRPHTAHCALHVARTDWPRVPLGWCRLLEGRFHHRQRRCYRAWRP